MNPMPIYPDWVKFDRYQIWVSYLADKEFRIFYFQSMNEDTLYRFSISVLYDHVSIATEWAKTEDAALARVHELQTECVDLLMERIL